MPFKYNPLSGNFDYYASVPNYVTELIYDSSESSPNNVNIFSDYDDLIGHINNDLGGARVRVSLRQNETLPARTNQNWNGITWSGNGTPAALGGLKLTLPDGFTISTWTNALIDGGLYLKSVSTTPIMTINYTFLFSMIFANVIGCTQCEFFRLTGNSTYFVFGVAGGGVIKNDGYEVVNYHSNFPILVTSVSGPNANIEANTMRGTVGFFFNQFADAAAALTSQTNTHANFSGTQSNANLVEASNLDWEAKSIATDTTTGLKIATSTSQKLGFFNKTPVAQPSATGETTGFTAGAGTAVKDDSTFTGNVGSTAYRINDIVKHLKNLGIIAS